METVKRKFKTKKQVNGSLARNFHPWAKDHGKTQVWQEGDYVIGVYVSDVVDNYKHKCPVIKVLDAELSTPVTDKDGNQVDIVGNNLQLNHCGSLSYAFYTENEKGKEAVSLGEIVQVTYLGKVVLETGPYAGSDSHQVDVCTMEVEDEVEETVENEADLY